MGTREVTGPVVSAGAGTPILEWAKARDIPWGKLRAAMKRGVFSKSLSQEPSGPIIRDEALADQEWAAGHAAPSTGLEAPAWEEDEPTRSGSIGSGPVALIDPQYADSDVDDSLEGASAREKFWKAKTAELRYLAEAGTLVSAADVEREISEMIAEAKTRLLGVASLARQRDATLSLAQTTLVDTLIREALESLGDDR